MSLTSQMWLEIECMCYLALLCIFWFAFSAFLVHFWTIFDFALILQVLFNFLDQICLYYSLEAFHDDIAIFGIIYEA